MLRYEIEQQGYDATITRFERKFSSYLAPTNAKNPPPGVPALALDYFPFNFSDKWPVLAVSELAPDVGTPVGTPTRGMRGSKIRAIRLGLRIYHPSLKPAGSSLKYEDGRATAKKATRAVWSAWFAAFEADQELAPYDVRLPVDLGDQDQAGGYLRQPNAPDTVLWVHSTTIEIAA